MIKFFLLLYTFLFFISSPVSAHIAGQPPFFLMNDKFADFYPVYTTSLSDFSLPQDIAPEEYTVNEFIHMKIDKTFLPFPPEVIETMQFNWDFGDGTTGVGDENTHVYNEPGSYLLTIHADYGEYSGPNAQPVIQAVLIHILPEKEYVLPRAKIYINTSLINDPFVDTISLSSLDKITVDASKSIEGSAPITEYFWDLGNGEKSTQEKVTYSINSEKAYLFPILRVKDANGFISDTYVQIENQSSEGSTTSTNAFSRYAVPVLIGFNIFTIGGVTWYMMKKK